MAKVDPKIQAAFNAEMAKTKVSMEAQREIQDALNSGSVQNIGHLKTLVSLAETFTSKMGGVTKELTAQEKLTQKIADNEYKQLDIVGTLQGKMKGNLAAYHGIGKEAKNLSKQLTAQYKVQLLNGKLTAAAYKELVATANETAALAQAMETIAASDLAAPFESAIGLADEMSGKIKGVFDAIPVWVA